MIHGKKYVAVIFLALVTSYEGKSQAQFQIWSGGNLGGAIYSQDFGFGDTDVNIAGSPLRAGITSFPYNNNVCPPAGSYTIVQQINVNNCSNNKWQTISLDHHQASFGRMMFVHNVSGSVPRVVYGDTVNQPLCKGTTYEFSAAIINIDNADSCTSASDAPRFLFTLENTSGAILASYTSPQIVAYPLSVTAGQLWKYSIYGLDYTLPDNINRLVLKITLLPSENNSNCGNDFAMDDILFSPAGPKVSISFNGFPEGTIVTGLCFQDNKRLTMSGSIDSFYHNTAFQWQQTSDNGTTWSDISGATGISYSQSFSAPDTFLFRLRGSGISMITNPACGSVSNVLKVEVDGIPSNISVTSNSPVCAGSDLQLAATGGASYTWSGPNGFYDNVSYAHIYHATLADSGTYYATIKTFGGCTATGATHVDVTGFDVKIIQGAPVCKGKASQLNVEGGSHYLWTPSGGLSDISIADPKASPAVTTKYTVNVTDDSGCKDTASTIVTVLNTIQVKAVISGSQFICRPSDSAWFKDMSLGEIAKWKWDFGNGAKSSLQDPLPQDYFIADNLTEYTAHLIVTDTAGCADTTSRVLKVENNCYIAVPTEFTPNGDGLNDYLYPLNAYKATSLTFRVYNRYGQLVFQTTDWTQKWDGNKNGTPMPAGVYVWQLMYTDQSNKKLFLKGFTLLIR